MKMRVKVIYAHPSRVAFYNNARLREHIDEYVTFSVTLVVRLMFGRLVFEKIDRRSTLLNFPYE